VPAGRHLIITVHGIRTFGQWQERLEALLKRGAHPGERLEVVHYKYGYFSAFAFLSVALRWVAVRRFRAELLSLTREPCTRVDIVAHSFGTYLVARALYSLRRVPGLRVNTVILAGSVLPSRFPWRRLVPDRVGRVINECGVKDNILLLSQAIPLLGMAGRVGFNGMTSENLRNRFFAFGHSGYFLSGGRPAETFMAARWQRLLLDETEVPLIDERPDGKFVGLEAFLLNNAAPAKVCVYSSLFLLLTIYGIPFGASIYANRLVSRDGGYVTSEVRGVKVQFDAKARPGASLAWMKSIGPVYQLDLAETKLDTGALRTLPPLPGLEILSLGKTGITKDVLPYLSRFPNLRELSLVDNPLKGLDGLPRLAGLRDLDLDNTGIDDSDLAQLARLLELRDLDISNNPITGSGFPQLAPLVRLETLKLESTGLDDASMRSLPALPRLRELSLYGTRIKGTGLRHLEAFSALQSLDLSYTTLDDEGLAHLPALPQLTELMLTSVKRLTGTSFSSTLGRFPMLQELWLKDTSVETRALISLTLVPKLRILALPGTKVGPGSLFHLRPLRELRELYLGETGVTDDDFVHLVGLPIRKLWLPGNVQLTDKALLAIRELRELRALNLERTSVTEAGLRRFRQSRPEVKISL